MLSLAFKSLINPVDRLNDKVTSYRLMLYFLLALLGWAMIGSFANRVGYDCNQILISSAWLSGVCWLTNKIVSRFLDIPSNKESDLITALILALILTPPTTGRDYAILAAAAIVAMVSKYIIAFYKSHIFNPAALGAFFAGEIFHNYPSWWVGTKFMAPLVIIGGILVLRKMNRFIMAGSFLAIHILYLLFGNSTSHDLHFLWLEIISTQVLFFAVVMLIEPLTSPPQLRESIIYTVIVGVLYSVTRLKLSPEEALLIGNLFAFLLVRNKRYQLKFIRQIKEADGIFSYLFSLPKNFNFEAGKYMEWTITHNKTDSRGNRRYFTIASSPTEPGLMVTVKQPDKPSAFKQKLSELKPGETILASHLSGNFTLPKDKSKKVAFLAGGVGITPFRSMVKYLIDKNEQRDAALVYSVDSSKQLAFKNLFAQAEKIGIKTTYATEGRLDESTISGYIPDFKQRVFYVSGPYGFVNAVQAALLKLGVSPRHIVTDYFPGYGG